MNIQILRKLADREEIDYQFLMSILRDYARPREKISAWLKTGELIRVKKGLYIFGREASRSPYSPEVLANLIYGPSAISSSYALAYYGLIPERVETITSITNKRHKLFSTPIGDFSYDYLNSNKYPIGITFANHESKQPFLIATPEKALCDYIHLTDREIILSTHDTAFAYLFHDLRLDENALRSFKLNLLNKIALTYQDERLKNIAVFIKKWRK